MIVSKVKILDGVNVNVSSSDVSKKMCHLLLSTISTFPWLLPDTTKKKEEEKGEVSPIAITLPPTGSSHTDVQCPSGNLQHHNKRLCDNLSLYCQCWPNIGVCLFAYQLFTWMAFLSLSCLAYTNITEAKVHINIYKWIRVSKKNMYFSFFSFLRHWLTCISIIWY